jgi:hypothetical protein
VINDGISGLQTMFDTHVNNVLIYEKTFDLRFGKKYKYNKI